MFQLDELQARMYVKLQQFKDFNFKESGYQITKHGGDYFNDCQNKRRCFQNVTNLPGSNSSILIKAKGRSDSNALGKRMSAVKTAQGSQKQTE